MPWLTLRAGGLLAAAALLLTACSSSGSSPSAGSTSPPAVSASSAPTTTAPASGGPSPAPSAPPSSGDPAATGGPQVTDPSPPSVEGPAGPAGGPPSPPVINRSNAVPPAQQAKAPPAVFTAPTVTYSDGLTVEVTDIAQDTVDQKGAGAFTGAPRTTFTVRFTNGTQEPVDLNEVVVSVVAGDPPAAAAPVYDETVSDFSGTVTPGAQASTKYAFSIPTASLATTALYVDFDGRHTAATFTGSVK